MIRKYRNQIFLGLLLILGLYILLLVIFDSQGQLSAEDGALAQMRAFPWWLVIPIGITQFFVIAFRFLEWHYYLGVIDARDKISLFDSIIIFVASFTMVVSPGKSAEVIKAALLKSKTGVSIARSTPVVLAERIVDGLAVIIIVFVSLFVAGNQLNLGAYGAIDYDLLSRSLIYTSMLLIVSGLIVIQIRPLALFFLSILGYIPLLRRLQQPLTDFYESSREIFHVRHVIPMTFVGGGVYVWSIAGFVIILYGFGLDITWQLVLQAAFIAGVVSAIGAFSFVPNGAGVTEISTLGMLLALVAPLQPMVTPAMAAAIALLTGLFLKWFRVLLGLVVGFVFRKRLFSEDLERIFEEVERERETSSKASAGEISTASG